MSGVEYEGVAEARARFKDLLDAASVGRPAGIRRDHHRFLVVEAERLRHHLAAVGPQPQVVAENGGWSLFFVGLPIAGDGDTLQDAVDDAIDALREYAEDWVDHLQTALNHKDNWGLVQLVLLSTNEQLEEWLVGFATKVAATK